MIFFFRIIISYTGRLNLGGLREFYVNFFSGKISQVLCFLGNAVVKTENLEQKILRSLFSNFLLPVIGNYDPVSLQISCRKLDQVEEIDRDLYLR